MPNSVSTEKVGKLETIFRQYRSALKARAARLLNHRIRQREDASDIIQITYYEAHRDLKKFQGETQGDYLHWVRRILSRNVIDVARFHRSAKRNPNKEKSPSLIKHLEGTDSWSSSVESPERRLERQETKEELLSALENLPDRQREALKMRYFQGESVQEIARHLQSTPGATARLLGRGLEKLKRHLKMEKSLEPSHRA